MRKADYIGCVKNEQIADQAAVHGWDNGVGLLQARMTNRAVTGGRIDNVHKSFSHKEYRVIRTGSSEASSSLSLYLITEKQP